MKQTIALFFILFFLASVAPCKGGLGAIDACRDNFRKDEGGYANFELPDSFTIKAPWRGGDTWIAGTTKNPSETCGGLLFGEILELTGGHVGPDCFALDFQYLEKAAPPTCGVDYGREILAIAPGKVKAIESDIGYGYHVIITHTDENGKENGYQSYYAHLQTNLQVATGDHVAQGDLLGYCGTSGSSTGSHLHFSLRKDGVSIPPFPMDGQTPFQDQNSESDDFAVLSSNKLPTRPFDLYFPLSGDWEIKYGYDQGDHTNPSLDKYAIDLVKISGTSGLGETVQAAHPGAGTVVKALSLATDAGDCENYTAPQNKANCESWGNLVIVQFSVDGRTYRVFYGGLDEVSVAEGETITTGQQIGTVGETSYEGGNYSGARLHFALTRYFPETDSYSAERLGTLSCRATGEEFNIDTLTSGDPISCPAGEVPLPPPTDNFTYPKSKLDFAACGNEIKVIVDNQNPLVLEDGVGRNLPPVELKDGRLVCKEGLAKGSMGKIIQGPQSNAYKIKWTKVCEYKSDKFNCYIESEFLTEYVGIAFSMPGEENFLPRCYYTDVHASQGYSNQEKEAVAQLSLLKTAEGVNVIEGYGVNDPDHVYGNFGPDDHVLREQFVAMAMRLAESLGINFDSPDPNRFPNFPQNISYADAGSISDWANDYIIKMSTMIPDTEIENPTEPLIRGYSNGNFGPRDPVSPGEALKMVVQTFFYNAEADQNSGCAEDWVNKNGNWACEWLNIANNKGISSPKDVFNGNQEKAHALRIGLAKTLYETTIAYSEGR